MGVLKAFLYTVVMFHFTSYMNPVYGNCPEDELSTSTATITTQYHVATTTTLPPLVTTGQVIDTMSTAILPSPSVNTTTTTVPIPVTSTGTDRSVYNTPTPTPQEPSINIPYFPFSTNTSVNAPAECPMVRDCKTWFEYGVKTSGIYPINPDGKEPFQVYCDMETDGGGWTVFQRRKDGSVDFYRNWADYEEGFGDLNGEFWLGLSKIHHLTQNRTDYTLRVDLEDFANNKGYAKYTTFNIGDDTTDYTITVGGYSGNIGDSLAIRHNGRKFSTKDRDNDRSGGHCAVAYKGAWWYNACHGSNLNGLYLRGYHSSYADSVQWYKWRGHYYSLKFSEMKVKKN